MAKIERVVFVPYARGRRGTAQAHRMSVRRDAAEAERRAEKAMAAGSVVGAHVVQISADEALGDYDDPVYLSSYGVVPEAQ